MGSIEIGAVYEHKFHSERVVEVIDKIRLRGYPCFKVCYISASNARHKGLMGTISENYLNRNYRMTYPGHTKPAWEV